MTRALITGVSGQDGFYLSELLQEKGYEVYGMVRRKSQPTNTPKGVEIVSGDVTDPGIKDIILDIKPDEIYNLAAMSFVWESFKTPKSTFDINAVGTLNVLEAARALDCKVYQASTSELYGSSPPPQNENTPFHPRSPYGVSKLAAHWLAINYREAYNLYVCLGVLFNHESPRRGMEFVTQKVCHGIADIMSGKTDKLVLGNLDAIRDWGHAKDYVRGMWMMMQQPEPDDYVLATGRGLTIRDLLETAFGMVGLDWREFVEVDEKFFRPAEVHALIGDASKMESIGWTREYTFETMIKEMLENALYGS